MSQFSGGMTVSLKISLMFSKLVMEKVMIELANMKLLMTKSVTQPLTLKDRWCYDNVDVTTDIDLCTFDLGKFHYPFSLHLKPKTCHRYLQRSVRDQTLVKYIQK